MRLGCRLDLGGKRQRLGPIAERSDRLAKGECREDCGLTASSEPEYGNGYDEDAAGILADIANGVEIGADGGLTIDGTAILEVIGDLALSLLGF